MINVSRLLKNWDYNNVLSTHNEGLELKQYELDKNSIIELISNESFDDIVELISYLDFDYGYLQDTISEFSDSNVDIYNYTLKCWFVDNSDFVDDAINEFGWDGVGKDIIKAISMGQYLMYQNGYYEAIEDLKSYLKDNFKF